MAAPKVPFKRIVKAGMKGDDVLALKIITSRAGCWPWQEFDNIAHPEFMNGRGKKGQTGIKGLQKVLRVSADGVYGPATHSKSLPFRVPRHHAHAGEYIWDGRAAMLYASSTVSAATKSAAIVADIFKWWDWMVARTASIHYSQVRPMGQMAARHEPPILPYWEDCSATFIYCAFLGGAKSPDIAYGFSGYGNTDSLVRCGRLISESEIPKYCKEHYVGAFYGHSHWNTVHVAAVKSPTQVYSMGSEKAPERWPNIHYDSPLVEVRAFEVI